MESLYKKKNLKFSGFHKEIKKGEVIMRRETSRQKRLSILRDISFAESKENSNEIQKSDAKKSVIPSRLEMLKRWKEEKTMKQQQKEPVKSVMKPGFCFKKQTSTSFGVKNKTDDSKIKVQNLSNITQRTVSQNTKMISKTTSQSTKPTCLPKKPSIPASKSTSTNIKPPRSVAAKSVSIPQPSTQKSKPISLSLRTSALQGKTTGRETKPKIPNPAQINSQPSKVAFPLKNIRIASKNASCLPKVTQKLPLTKSKLDKDTKNTNIPSNDKPSKFAFPKHINNPNSKLLSKRNQTSKDHSTNAETTESRSKTGEIFNCDISMIEPSMKRKSFAPQNFLFCPPTEWSFAFQIDVSSPGSLLKLRSNGVQRTSSPLKLEESLKSANEISTFKKEDDKDSSLNDSLHEGITSLKEKIKTSPVGQKSLSNASTQPLNMNDISEMKRENISASDSITNSNPKTPLKARDDINSENIGNLQENVTNVNDGQNSALNVEPDLLVALDNSIGKLQEKVTEAKEGISPPPNVEHTILVAFDNSAPHITSKDCPSLSKNLKQDKTWETADSSVFEDNKLINLEPVDLFSSYKSTGNSASPNIRQTLIQIDGPSVSVTKSCPDSFVSNSSKTSQQNKLQETVKVDTSEIVEDIKLVNIDLSDVKFSCKSNDSNTLEINGDESVVSILNNSDRPYLCVASSGQDRPLNTANCITPKTLEGMSPIKIVDFMSSYSASENGLIEVENHVDPCPSTLSESLKSFNIPTSVAERVSRKTSMGHRKSKMSLRHALESINESIENKDTPCATPMSVKKLIVEDTFTPRRSPRLAEKLNRSGSFESILNIEKPEMMNSLDLDDIKLKVKTNARNSAVVVANGTPLTFKKKSREDKDFTPRRSQRLSELLRRSSSFENLFDVRRPSIMGSPSKVDFPVGEAAGITYDFDNLALEDSPKVIKSIKGRTAQVSKKVSLLYTPPTRKSTLRQSIREDLMSFSPL